MMVLNRVYYFINFIFRQCILLVEDRFRTLSVHVNVIILRKHYYFFNAHPAYEKLTSSVILINN